MNVNAVLFPHGAGYPNGYYALQYAGVIRRYRARGSDERSYGRSIQTIHVVEYYGLADPFLSVACSHEVI